MLRSPGTIPIRGIVSGVSTPVHAKHSQNLSIAVTTMIIYQAFIEDELEIPKHLARRIHDLHFHPQFEDFQPRTMWSLSNAFRSAFKELVSVPPYRRRPGSRRARAVGPRTWPWYSHEAH